MILPEDKEAATSPWAVGIGRLSLWEDSPTEGQPYAVRSSTKGACRQSCSLQQTPEPPTKETTTPGSDWVLLNNGTELKKGSETPCLPKTTTPRQESRWWNGYVTTNRPQSERAAKATEQTNQARTIREGTQRSNESSTPV